MTYKGHRVLQTLIRCHFSPAETTGAQYLYSGSADGRIHVCNPRVYFGHLQLICTDLVIGRQSRSYSGSIENIANHGQPFWTRVCTDDQLHQESALCSRRQLAYPCKFISVKMDWFLLERVGTCDHERWMVERGRHC